MAEPRHRGNGALHFDYITDLIATFDRAVAPLKLRQHQIDIILDKIFENLVSYEIA